MTLTLTWNSWRDTYAIESDISTDLIEYLGRIFVKDTKSVWKKILSNSKSHELNETIKSLMMIVYDLRSSVKIDDVESDDDDIPSTGIYEAESSISLNDTQN